jgi:N-[(2S)-2-amino-2-carboxyethyl]-L-glutamate dehydrogenase
VNSSPQFGVVTGAQVAQAVRGREKDIVDLVEQTYRLHGEGRTVNPPSYFLRFSDRPDSRIIALPASVGGSVGVDGLKWISSFPGNISSGLPRASAALLLNDPSNGYPFALLESSIISAVRTAASAALAADRLSRGRRRPTRVGFVGTGLIARYIHTYLAGTGWLFDEINLFDLDSGNARQFAEYVRRGEDSAPVVTRGSCDELIRACDLVVFATVAGTPHVTDPGVLDHGPLVLHVSLRDLAPELILGAVNVVDDVEHCLKANTSVHLAEQRTGNRDFIAGTLDDVLAERLRPGPGPLIFSPFGLGVLDLAVGKWVYDGAKENGGLQYIDDFFFELDRYGNASSPTDHSVRA